TVAEGDGARLAPVLTADPHLEPVACGTSVPRPHGYELLDALLIQHLAGIVRQSSPLHVAGQAASCVVTAHSQRGLREVVRPEREELGFLRYPPCRERSARELDHGSYQVGYRRIAGLEDLRGHAVDYRPLMPEFLHSRHKGHHD